MLLFIYTGGTMEYQHIIHPFEALYDEDSRILVLGSFPSVKSREQKFFYGHPQNRFWQVTAAVFEDDVPETIERKKQFLHRHHVAAWDVIDGCDIKGPGHSSIKNAVPTDLQKIIRNSRVSAVFCNGKTSGRMYEKYHEPVLKMKAQILPSTSPANAAWTLERLIEVWRKIRQV